MFLALACVTVSGILTENTLLKARSKLLIPRHQSYAPSFFIGGPQAHGPSLTPRGSVTVELIPEVLPSRERKRACVFPKAVTHP